MRLLLSCGFLPFFLMPLDARDMTLPWKAVSPPPVAEEAPPESTDEGAEEASPTPPADGCPEPRVARGHARSIGTPTHGRLARGRFLGESELVHHVDAEGCNFWGTEELLGVIERIAATVAEEHPGHRLTVGELSKREGGDIIGHASHENGRDVDFGFYFVDEEGQPYEPERLLNVRRDGTAREGDRVLTFDVARNWKVVETLLTSEEADVNIIVVGSRVRHRLLTHARRTGVPEELYRRAERVLLRPRRGRHPHRNHFHVRIYCPVSHGHCRDRGRVWDWVERARAERAGSAPEERQAAADQPSGVRSAASASSTASSRS